MNRQQRRAVAKGKGKGKGNGGPATPARPAAAPAPAPMASTALPPEIRRGEALGDLVAVRRSSDLVEQRARVGVLAAREAGCSWASIGSALGLSGEGARRKFSRVTR